jgi:hypothetical protein
LLYIVSISLNNDGVWIIALTFFFI